MTDLTNLLADIQGRKLAASAAEVTFNGDSLDQDYIRALEATSEDVPRLLGALDAVLALAAREQLRHYISPGDEIIAAVVAALGEDK